VAVDLDAHHRDGFIVAMITPICVLPRRRLLLERVTPVTRRRPLPTIEGITFAATAHTSRMTARLKFTGDLALYGLSNMGEVRLAHHNPDIDYKNGRGVFVRLIPTATGVAVTQRRKNFPSKRIKLTSTNFEEFLKSANARRAIVKNRLKGGVKVSPISVGLSPAGNSNRSEASTEPANSAVTVRS
jgi:hypothetical protein